MSHQPAPAISSDQLAEQCGRTAMFASVWLVGVLLPFLTRRLQSWLVPDD